MTEVFTSRNPPFVGRMVAPDTTSYTMIYNPSSSSSSSFANTHLGGNQPPIDSPQPTQQPFIDDGAQDPNKHQPPPPHHHQQSTDRLDGKMQTTFLTKPYELGVAFSSFVLFHSYFWIVLQLGGGRFFLNSLLERPEYQHMIRWDGKGEQIIVERPEQLALHVLPSIYRQSRFASFSRQLNVCMEIWLGRWLPHALSRLFTDLWLHAQGQPS